jgi:hypothetical protein
MSVLHAGPPAQGLYDPRFEHDACGVAFVATLTGDASHDIVAKALTALRNLDHRGAAGAEANSGDGAGILLQVPHGFLAEVVDFELPGPGSYAVGAAFLEGDPDRVAKTRQRVEELADEEGLIVLGWRDVPVDPQLLGATARSVMPLFSQLFVAAAGHDDRFDGVNIDGAILVRTIREAPWLASGGTAEVYRSSGALDPVSLVRLLVRRASQVFCIPREGTAKADLPTQIVPSDDPAGQRTVLLLAERVLGLAVPVRPIGFVRNLVVAVPVDYSWPAPVAHFVVFEAQGEPAIEVNGFQ